MIIPSALGSRFSHLSSTICLFGARVFVKLPLHHIQTLKYIFLSLHNILIIFHIIYRPPYLLMQYSMCQSLIISDLWFPEEVPENTCRMAEFEAMVEFSVDIKFWLSSWSNSRHWSSSRSRLKSGRVLGQSRGLGLVKFLIKVRSSSSLTTHATENTPLNMQ